MKKIWVFLALVSLMSVQSLHVVPKVQASMPSPIITSSGEIGTSGIYYINSPSGLIAISDYFKDHVYSSGTTFVLAADIDMQGFDWIPIGLVNEIDTPSINQSDPNNLQPLDPVLGYRTKYFQGVFDGSGFTISNLNINRTDLSYYGLFGFVNSDALIKNLTLENVSFGSVNDPVEGNAGALVGEVSDSTIQNVTLSGTVVIHGKGIVGGLVGGLFASTITNSTIKASNITITNSAMTDVFLLGYTGGFIGLADSSYGEINIFDSSIETDDLVVSGLGDKVGGFIGYGYSSGLSNPLEISGISLIANTSISVEGYDDVGGFMGFNDGNIFNVTMATSGLTVIANDDRSGGFVGANDHRIEQVSITVSGINVMSSDDEAGGFVGLSRANAIVSGVSMAITSVTSVEGAELVGGFVGQNRGIMTNLSLISSGLNVTAEDQNIGGFVGENRGNVSNINILSPVVEIIGSHAVGGFVGYSRSSGVINSGLFVFETMQISGIQDIGGFGGLVLSTLNDITTSGTSLTVNGELNYVGGFIGSSQNNTLSGIQLLIDNVSLAGKNGVGGYIGYAIGQHTTSGLVMNITTMSGIGSNLIGGVIGELQQDGQIMNTIATIETLYLEGRSQIGGLVGISQGKISNTSLISESIDILAEFNAGGFVGFQRPNPYDDITIPFMIDSGLVRATNLSITGTSDASYIGGFIGQNDDGTINKGSVIADQILLSGLDYIGGFVGYNKASVVSNDAFAFFGIIGDSVVQSSEIVINGQSKVGGFVGHNHLTIDSNNAIANDIRRKIHSSTIEEISIGSGLVLTINGLDYVGGFVGLNEARITGTNSSKSTLSASGVTIEGRSYLGGYVGAHSGVFNLIDFADLEVNHLTISGVDPLNNAYQIGGFAGVITDIGSRINNISFNFDQVNVAGTREVGGLVGRLHNVLHIENFDKSFPVFSGLSVLVEGSGLTLSSGTINAPFYDTYSFSINIFPLYEAAIENSFLGCSNNLESGGLPLLVEACDTNALYTGYIWGRVLDGFPLLVSQSSSPEPDPEPTPPAPTVPVRPSAPVVVRVVILDVQDLVLNYGETVRYPLATAVDKLGSVETDITSLIVRTGEVGSELGSYEVTYTVTSNGVTNSKTVTVRVVDIVPPSIVYTGVTEIYLGDEFEPSFDTSDNAPGAVRVVIERLPDLTIAGEQLLTAVATDASGNQTRIEVLINVLQEQIVLEEVKVNQANLLFVLNSRNIDLDTVRVFVAVASSEPSPTATIWMPYTTTTYEASEANQFVYVKVQDASGIYQIGSPVPLSYQSSEVRLEPITEVAPVESNRIGVVGILALSGAAVAGFGLVYWQRHWFADFGNRFADAKSYLNKQKRVTMTSLWILLGLRREYKVLFYDDKELVSEQVVKRGDAAKAPFKAKWDQKFDEVKEDLIIHRVK